MLENFNFRLFWSDLGGKKLMCSCLKLIWKKDISNWWENNDGSRLKCVLQIKSYNI